eukprot:4525725-Prymnesium_polylepis.2
MLRRGRLAMKSKSSTSISLRACKLEAVGVKPELTLVSASYKFACMHGSRVHTIAFRNRDS